MRTILNFIICGFILWIAAHFFPATVQIDSMGTLALATILIWVVGIVVGLLCLLMFGVGALFENIPWVIAGIILALFSDVIALTILSNNLSGFMVVGFWPKVLLSVCFTLFSLRSPSSD